MRYYQVLFDTINISRFT